MICTKRLLLIFLLTYSNTLLGMDQDSNQVLKSLYSVKAYPADIECVKFLLESKSMQVIALVIAIQLLPDDSFFSTDFESSKNMKEFNKALCELLEDMNEIDRELYNFEESQEIIYPAKFMESTFFLLRTIFCSLNMEDAFNDLLKKNKITITKKQDSYAVLYNCKIYIWFFLNTAWNYCCKKFTPDSRSKLKEQMKKALISIEKLINSNLLCSVRIYSIENSLLNLLPLFENFFPNLNYIYGYFFNCILNCRIREIEYDLDEILNEDTPLIGRKMGLLPCEACKVKRVRSTLN